MPYRETNLVEIPYKRLAVESEFVDAIKSDVQMFSTITAIYLFFSMVAVVFCGIYGLIALFLPVLTFVSFLIQKRNVKNELVRLAVKQYLEEDGRY